MHYLPNSSISLQLTRIIANAVVLHEDKDYYPSQREVYGEDVETMVQERDNQSLSEPIIKPVENKLFIIEEKELPTVNYTWSWQSSLMGLPEHIRNIAIVGHLNHGKTSLLDLLVKETHVLPDRDRAKIDEQLRYTDTHILEQERGLTIKSSPISLVLQNTKEKSYLFNIMDTPGHVNFLDEVSVATQFVDGLVLVVDVVEGLMITARKVIEQACLEKIPIVLVLNKVDRLILDLKLPPSEAYYKLRYCIDQVNTLIKENTFNDDEFVPLSPEKGNVVFASSTSNFIFSTYSFALHYKETSPSVDAVGFSKRLWGDIYYNPESRKFSRKPLENGAKRTFEHFILDPLYKIFTSVLEKEKEDLSETLAKLNIYLKPSTYSIDVRPLLQTVCQLFFGNSAALVDAVLEHIKSPTENAKAKVERVFTGPLDSEVAKSMSACDSNGPLVIHVAKLFSSPDSKEMYALGRVMSGTISQGQRVSVLGETYSEYDTEDLNETTVSGLWVYQSRYKIPMEGVPAGNWALIKGVDSSIVKSATIYSADFNDDMHIFKPISYMGEAIFKVAVEPVNPSELPKMLEGLRKVSKSYALLQTKAEESGEHVILGSGELYMDCVLYDLRILYADMAIKVSDPVVRFSETCIETSRARCYAITPNKQNKISIIAQPLDKSVAADIEAGNVVLEWGPKKVAKYMNQNHDWDLLAGRSIWAFGPEDNGPNVLMDDTIPDEVDKKLLFSVKESIKQGFQWAVRDGPLCEEPIRNTQYKIVDVVLASQPNLRNSNQIISTARRACYSAFLAAAPRLMEPIYQFHIVVPYDHASALSQTVERRRGYIASDKPVAGTQLRLVTGTIPVIDSIGFETDVRIVTKGFASVSLLFHEWDNVPGDPLDSTQRIPQLEPAPQSAMAREFIVKTRRRKGLSDDLPLTKLFDPSLVKTLQEADLLPR